MKRALLFVALVGVFCLSQGCMQEIRGNTQVITITSDPSGAEVEITGPTPEVPATEIYGGTAYIQPMIEWKARGRTPVKTKLRRDGTYHVKIWMAGYNTEEFDIEHNLSAWWWLDLLVTAIVGGLIDLSSGAAYDLEPSAYHAELTRR